MPVNSTRKKTDGDTWAGLPSVCQRSCSRTGVATGSVLLREQEQSRQLRQFRLDRWGVCLKQDRALGCLPEQQAQACCRQQPLPRIGRRGFCTLQHPWSAPAQQEGTGKGCSSISPVAPQTSVFTAICLNKHMSRASSNRLETANPIIFTLPHCAQRHKIPASGQCMTRGCWESSRVRLLWLRAHFVLGPGIHQPQGTSTAATVSASMLTAREVIQITGHAAIGCSEPLPLRGGQSRRRQAQLGASGGRILIRFCCGKGTFVRRWEGEAPAEPGNHGQCRPHGSAGASPSHLSATETNSQTAVRLRATTPSAKNQRKS